jgi:hypothetical protein
MIFHLTLTYHTQTTEFYNDATPFILNVQMWIKLYNPDFFEGRGVEKSVVVVFRMGLFQYR